MREKQNQPFHLSFNASLKIDFQGSRVTSDGGLILVRELDERLGFGYLIVQLQRALRVDVLSPADAVQPRRRLSGGQAAARQCAQG